jgi:hypothetical protein
MLLDEAQCAYNVAHPERKLRGAKDPGKLFCIPEGLHADVECQGQQFRRCFPRRYRLRCGRTAWPNGKSIRRAFAPIFFHGDINAPGA